MHDRGQERFDRMMRREAVQRADDFKRLKEALESAASRFDDIASLIEQSGPYTDVNFLRASAERCRLAAASDADLETPVN
jgi:hypothetical protein